MFDIQEHVEAIEAFLEGEFEKDLFTAILRNLEDKKNALRINNFAYGARELISIILSRLAPDDDVSKCVWFKQEHTLPQGCATRKQKVRYSIIGELCSEYIQKNFDVDLTSVEKCIADEYDNLSKYAHIRRGVFPVIDKENILALESLSSLSRFIASINDTRHLVETHMYEELNKTIYFEITDKHMDVFSHLAWITRVDDVYIDDIEITKDHTHLYCKVFGSASVDLECSRGVGESDEDCYLGSVSCPFEVQAHCSVTDLKDIEFGEFRIDTPY